MRQQECKFPELNNKVKETNAGKCQKQPCPAYEATTLPQVINTAVFPPEPLENLIHLVNQFSES